MASFSDFSTFALSVRQLRSAVDLEINRQNDARGGTECVANVLKTRIPSLSQRLPLTFVGLREDKVLSLQSEASALRPPRYACSSPDRFASVGCCCRRCRRRRRRRHRDRSLSVGLTDRLNRVALCCPKNRDKTPCAKSRIVLVWQCANEAELYGGDEITAMQASGGGRGERGREDKSQINHDLNGSSSSSSSDLYIRHNI